MNQEPVAGCDLLVVSPHTDDLEIGAGGTVALLTDQGRQVWGLDLTGGELGSNATVDERWQEAAAASLALGLSGRVQLELPDGFIDAGNRGQVEQVAAWLRMLRPRWVITAPDPVRHPDHQETPRLVAKACFMARLASWTPAPAGHRLWAGGARPDTPASRWEVETVLNVCPDQGQPSLVFDVGRAWEKKLAALECYQSQFRRGSGRRETAINDPAFLERMQRRARTWGQRAGIRYGEAFQTAAVPVLSDLPGQRWI